MCGRFSLGTSDLKSEYDLETQVKLTPRYNITPGSDVPVIINSGSGNRLVMMRWGYQWKNKEGHINQVINAKSETAHEKPMFRKSLEFRRCILPATGFYEWVKTPDGKIPYYIFLKEREMFSLGGLYRIEHDSEGNEQHTCVIITTAANEMMKAIHHRMPLIINKRDENKWLTTEDKAEILDLLEPYPSQEMNAYTVSKRVNTPINDDPDLVQEFSYEVK